MLWIKSTDFKRIKTNGKILKTLNSFNLVKKYFGLSGGLGFDLKKSLSVFLGGSVIYHQNITISTGLAFHNQKLINSKYKEGDVINENLSFEQLHTDYVRLNPFISISFRLDKSPF